MTAIITPIFDYDYAHSFHQPTRYSSLEFSLGPMTFKDTSPSANSLSYHWDLQVNCASAFPVLQYISRKLAQRNLHLAFIISAHERSIIPAWHISSEARITLTKAIHKASMRFTPIPGWLKSLAGFPVARSPSQDVESCNYESYVVHRSLVQHDVAFTGEGLTLLNIDHIFTFKRLLQRLSKNVLVSLPREDRTDICVLLLRRINAIYTGNKFSKGYLLRAYDHIELNEEALEDICKTYKSRYDDIGIIGMEREKRLPRSPHGHSNLSASISYKNNCKMTRILTNKDLPKLDTNLGHMGPDIPISNISRPESSISKLKYPTIKRPSGLPSSPKDTSCRPKLLCFKCQGPVVVPRTPLKPVSKDSPTLRCEWNSVNKVVGLNITGIPSLPTR
ncbi:hypothetical protein MMC12_004276 [Toensbergia leucococca]|nr:hypothetical protein [Toensbergia leucococca]